VSENKRFLEERLNTPDLRAAQRELDDVDSATIEGVHALDEAARGFGDPQTLAIFTAPGNEQTFGALSSNISRTPEGDWALQEARVYKVPQVSGGNAQEGGSEGGAPTE